VLDSAREGEGERVEIAAITLVGGDSLRVWTLSPNQRLLFSPDYRLDGVDILGFPPTNQVLTLDRGRSVLNLELQAADRVGLPLHLVEGGSITRSFGSTTGVYRPDVPGMTLRRISRGREGRIWSAWVTRYLIERWTVDGDHEGEISRPAPWFPPYGDSPGLPAMRSAVLEDIWEDSRGRLWTAIRVPDAHQPESRPTRGDGGFNRAAYFDTILEVLDPAAGRVIASTRIPESAINFIEGGLLSTTRRGPDGRARVDILTFALSGVDSIGG
jgi:hypothetical protein